VPTPPSESAPSSTTSWYPVDRDITNTAIGPFGPNAIFIRFRPGTDAEAEMAHLRAAIPTVADFAGADVLSAQRPAEIVNSNSIVATAPALLAGALALGAIASLAMALGATVRRRRQDLIVLKVIGFTRGQLRPSPRKRPPRSRSGSCSAYRSASPSATSCGPDSPDSST
jgi:hypothetical protein